MRLSEHVYQLSGVSMATNSNMYAIDTGKTIVLIDSGAFPEQWELAHKMLAYWNLDKKPIEAVLFTHSHYDHAGNAHLAKAEGAKIMIGEEDAEAIENGDKRTLDFLFGRPFTPVRADVLLHDGDMLTFGECEIECIHVPGHTHGSMMFLLHEEPENCLFLGDFVELGPVPAKDDITVKLAWMGAPDFDPEGLAKTLERLKNMPPVLLMPGHYYGYYLDSRRVFEDAYKLGMEMLNA